MNQHLVERIIIAYGSESGNAEGLARQLAEFDAIQSTKLELAELNDIELESLTTKDLLLLISSTFGDGEPPGNAELFASNLENAATIPAFQFAVFGLGDVAYSNFCRFGQIIDEALAIKGAKRIINRVDADLDYRGFFSQWKETLSKVLTGDFNAGKQLNLQVKPYNESTPHSAKVLSATHINQDKPGVYAVELDIRGSAMNYCAGDLLYVMPAAQTALIASIAEWFNDETATTLLKDKELRLLNKSLLRTLAAKSNNETLKNRLKIRNKAELAEYLYGRDLLDVLQDCGPANTLSISELADLLPEQAPRAYSIASAGIASEESGEIETVNLCVRDIEYSLNDRTHYGSGSHFLSQRSSGDSVNVFTRSNPEFHLDSSDQKPIIMIGAGTGIAPYIGFLEQLEHAESPQESLLFFGERHSDKDFLYQERLEEWLDKGTLSRLFTAFSRDQSYKYYVQDALLQHGKTIWDCLERDATIYVCGSKSNLGKSIDQTLLNVAQKFGNLTSDQSEKWLSTLSETGRYRRDLY